MRAPNLDLLCVREVPILILGQWSSYPELFHSSTYFLRTNARSTRTAA